MMVYLAQVDDDDDDDDWSTWPKWHRGVEPTHAQEDALLRTQAVRRTSLLAQHTDFSNCHCPHANGEIRKNIHKKYQKQAYNDRMRTTQDVRRTNLLKHRFL